MKDLLVLAEAVAQAFSANGEYNAHTAEHSTRELRQMAQRAIRHARERSAREKELLAALLALRAEAQPYEDDEGLDKAKRRADRVIRRAMMARLK